MAKIKEIGKIELEELFKMESGYVLDFSNDRFRSFVLKTVNVDIYADKYNINGDSKAKRLRAFCKLESNYKVKQLLLALIEYRKVLDIKEKRYNEDYVIDNKLVEECIDIANSLNDDDDIEMITSLQKKVNSDEEMNLLLESIKSDIEKLEPRLVIDRLHTYCTWYFRKLCSKHKLPHDENVPLDGLFGKYFKYIDQNKYLEARMSRDILKSTMSILGKYNYVRNNQSYAHPNKILNKAESMLIYRNVTSMLNFIDSLESITDN